VPLVELFRYYYVLDTVDFVTDELNISYQKLLFIILFLNKVDSMSQEEFKGTYMELTGNHHC
jgi:hypothetical protein